MLSSVIKIDPQLQLYLFFIETYISCRSLLVLCNAALQVEGQVITADQDSLPELLLKLPNVWLDAGEVQFLWKRKMLSKGLICRDKNYFRLKW